MASSRYYIYLILGVLAVVVTTFFASYCFFALQNFTYGSLLAVFVPVEVFIFINQLNKTNRKIAAFFTAVNNQDTSIKLPKSTTSKAIKDIYDGMTKTIEVFQSVKMESEFREKLFMAMIEHSTTGFISIDEHGDFEIMNQMARDLLGVEYTSNLDRLKTETPEFHELLIALKPGQSKSCKINQKNRSTTIQVSSSRLNYKNKKLNLVSMLDIQREIDAKELESWQKLIRIMNHEIMNSIAPITSAAKSLTNIFFKNGKIVDSKELSAQSIRDTANCLEVIDSMSSGLTHFVGNYRKMSKIPNPELKTIDIQKWGETLAKILPECVKSTDTIEVKIDSHLKTFMGDERLLNQVLINLVKNASDATNSTDEKQIKVILEPAVKGSLNIKVWNNGELIAPENLDKIFIPLFTTKEDGAGVGLYISRQIVNLHGGSLTVASKEGEGTGFSVLV